MLVLIVLLDHTGGSVRSKEVLLARMGKAPPSGWAEMSQMPVNGDVAAAAVAVGK